MTKVGARHGLMTFAMVGPWHSCFLAAAAGSEDDRPLVAGLGVPPVEVLSPDFPTPPGIHRSTAMTMSRDAFTSSSASRLRKPDGPIPADQAPWNPQRTSQLPFHRYKPFHEFVEPVSL